MHDTIDSDNFSPPKDTLNSSTNDERISCDLEFKIHTQSRSGSSLSPLGSLASSGSDHQQCQLFVKANSQCVSNTYAYSPTVRNENMVVSSNELNLSVTAPNPPVCMVTSVANVPAEVDSDKSQKREFSEIVVRETQSVHKTTGSLITSERPLEDGYNWRKYGQKHVKGSEFPRSYYKCTHPNFQVRKQLECAQDGKITKIVHKGKHDHPKPQPTHRMPIGTILSIREGRSDMFSSLQGSEGSEASFHIEPNGTPELSAATASDGDIESSGAQLNRIVNDDPESNCRRKDFGKVDDIPMGKATREPRVVVQSLSEVDILDDGYHWRKYGQKVVKRNPNPRSYYKCTNSGCPVRKHVERASHDLKNVITTYEGKHNHDVPAARTSSHENARHTIFATATKVLSITREESDTIGLYLGVGIRSPENSSNEKQQTTNVEPSQG